MLIDIHSHLDHVYFDKDRDETVARAREAGVKVLVTAGINPETNRKALEYAEKYDIVKACLGIYPVQTLQEEIKQSGFPLKSFPFNIDEEISFITKHKKNIIAVAEVGLDYYWTTEYVSEQKELFQKMIELAKKINKPILVHSRKAEADCIEMLASSKLKHVIMHCFAGKKKLVKEIVDKGWFLTAPTNIVKSTQFQENVALCPITQLFCETDAPYLTPNTVTPIALPAGSVPEGFHRNESSYISEAYKKVAEIKMMEYEEVVKGIWMNWQKIT